MTDRPAEPTTHRDGTAIGTIESIQIGVPTSLGRAGADDSFDSPWTSGIYKTPVAGPVLVTVEYNIDPERATEFMEIMEATRQARLRLGTLQWNLMRDSADPSRFVECFMDENWTEHLRRLQRFTVADKKLREQRLAFHVGSKLPLIRRLIGTGSPLP